MRTSLARCFWPYSFTMRNISAPLSFPLLALAIASCSPAPPEPAPAPQPPKVVAPAPPVVTQPQGDWIDWPIASGTWVYRKDDRGSLALFGPAGGDALLMVRCNASQRQLILSRAGSVRDSATMVLRASDGVQSYSAGNSGGSPPYVAASLSPNDMMMDRIAYSRGRFAVETTGLQSLAIPVAPEFSRVVEDCRA